MFLTKCCSVIHARIMEITVSIYISYALLSNVCFTYGNQYVSQRFPCWTYELNKSIVVWCHMLLLCLTRTHSPIWVLTVWYIFHHACWPPHIAQRGYSSGARQELTWLYKGTGTVLQCYSRERLREEGGWERVSSHLVVLKTPGMLLL